MAEELNHIESVDRYTMTMPRMMLDNVNGKYIKYEDYANLCHELNMIFACNEELTRRENIVNTIRREYKEQKKMFARHKKIAFVAGVGFASVVAIIILFFCL